MSGGAQALTAYTIVSQYNATNTLSSANNVINVGKIGAPWDEVTHATENYDYGSTTEPVSVSFTFTNNDCGPMSVSAISFTENSGAYTVESENCTGTSMNPGSSCTVTVLFEAPKDKGGNYLTGSYTDSLYLNTPGSGTFQSLTGEWK